MAFAFVALVALLLPRHIGVYWVVSTIAAILILGFIRSLTERRLVLLGAIAALPLTAILVLTEPVFPYGGVIVAVAALGMSVASGWVATRRPRARQPTSLI
jgi:hypothetical protein